MSEAMRDLTPAICGLPLVLSFSALGVKAVMSFPFFFAPGCANGWARGLTIYQVWSTWLTLTLLLMLMTVGVGVSSVFSLVACIFRKARRHAGSVFGIFMALWVIFSVATCAWAFREIYASTLEMWPNGYPG